MTRIVVHHSRFDDDEVLDTMWAWLAERCGDDFSVDPIEEGRRTVGLLFRIPTRALALQFRDLFA